MKKYSSSLTALATLSLLCSWGCSKTDNQVHQGDKLQVDFTCRQADGSLVETTLAHIAGDENIVKSTMFSLHPQYTSLHFQAFNDSDPFPYKPFDPLELKIGLAIANNADKLLYEQPVVVQLPSEEVKEMPTRERFLPMTMRYTLERLMVIPMMDFKAQNGGAEPTIGGKVGETSQFPGEIRNVTDETVTVYYSASPGATTATLMGPMPVRELDANTLEVTMEVRPGQLVQRVGGLPGRITSVDKDQFTIDFGQTFASETLSCEVVAHQNKSDQSGKQTAAGWIEDYQQGLSKARRQNKQVVLLLIDDTCPACAIMEKKIQLDPSLQTLRDRFILVKTNIKQQEELAKRFGHRGHPTTLILDSLGNELERMSGEQHIATIAYKLDQVLNKGKKG